MKVGDIVDSKEDTRIRASLQAQRGSVVFIHLRD